MTKLYAYALATILMGLSACIGGDQTSKDNSQFVVDSKGGIGEIVVVMDPKKWDEPLGKALRNVFARYIPALPQPESWFKLMKIPPSKFKSFMKRHHNIVILASLDNTSLEGRYLKGYFTQKSIDLIKKDPKKFMMRRKDVFAKGQRVMYLFGNNDTQLIENMTKNKDQLLNYFHDMEQKRLTKDLYNIAEQYKLSNYVKDIMKVKVRIPAGFKLAKKDKNFVWLRKPGDAALRKADINLLMASRPYTSTKVFDEQNIIAWRDSLGKKYTNDPTLTESYVVTETRFEPALITKRIIKDKKFAVEYRGFWKLKNGTRGGAFISYAFVDEAQKKVFYLEGFIYAPGMKKKDAIFQTEAILRTFERIK
ncbi:DUF4837 family protein [Microscilla marina]|nr:DUF4837 family protein [Microscilla marina]